MKYVFFGPVFGPAKAVFNDIWDDKDVAYFEDIFSVKNMYIHKLLCLLLQICINHHVPLIELFLIFTRKFNFEKNEKIIFVYFNPNVVFSQKIGYVNKLKTLYPHSKHVVYYLDVQIARKVHNDEILQLYDKVLIFDEPAAKELNVGYYITPYSVSNKYPKKIKYDVCYVGKCKNRFDDIIAAYNYMKKNNLNVYFYLVDAPSDFDGNGLDLICGTGISYEECLNLYSMSKSILEIKIRDADSYSLRVYDAFSLNKLLIINNTNIIENRFYNEKYVKVYNNIEELNFDFLDTYQEVNYNYHNDNSPTYFLDYLKNNLYL